MSTVPTASSERRDRIRAMQRPLGHCINAFVAEQRLEKGSAATPSTLPRSSETEELLPRASGVDRTDGEEDWEADGRSWREWDGEEADNNIDILSRERRPRNDGSKVCVTLFCFLFLIMFAWYFMRYVTPQPRRRDLEP